MQTRNISVKENLYFLLKVKNFPKWRDFPDCYLYCGSLWFLSSSPNRFKHTPINVCAFPSSVCHSCVLCSLDERIIPSLQDTMHIPCVHAHGWCSSLISPLKSCHWSAVRNSLRKQNKWVFSSLLLQRPCFGLFLNKKKKNSQSPCERLCMEGSLIDVARCVATLSFGLDLQWSGMRTDRWSEWRLGDWCVRVGGKKTNKIIPSCNFTEK